MYMTGGSIMHSPSPQVGYLEVHNGAACHISDKIYYSSMLFSLLENILFYYFSNYSFVFFISYFNFLGDHLNYYYS